MADSDLADDDGPVLDPWPPDAARHRLVHLAILSGQPLTGPSGLESWHPRDVDTLQAYYEQQASAARMDAARAELARQMG